MKKFSIALNILCVIVSLFFIVYANIQAELAAERDSEIRELRYEAQWLKELAEKEAENALEAQSLALKTQKELEECRNGQ